MGLTPERKAAEETLGKLKRLRKGSRISIKNTELLADKQSKETRNNGDKRRAQHTVSIFILWFYPFSTKFGSITYERLFYKPIEAVLFLMNTVDDIPG